MSRRWYVVAAVAVAALAAGGVVLLRAGGGSAATPERAVERYLDALARRDAGAVAAAVEPGTSRAAVDDRLREFGGVPRADVTVRIAEPVRPGAARVVDLAFGSRPTEVLARRRGDGWVVAFPPPAVACDPGREVCDAEPA